MRLMGSGHPVALAQNRQVMVHVAVDDAGQRPHAHRVVAGRAASCLHLRIQALEERERRTPDDRPLIRQRQQAALVEVRVLDVGSGVASARAMRSARYAMTRSVSAMWPITCRMLHFPSAYRWLARSSSTESIASRTVGSCSSSRSRSDPGGTRSM